VLHSRLHEVWALRMGTFLGVGNDPRYTPTTTFETFPFPRPTDKQREAIATTARELDTKRAAWLRMIHERLDVAVFAAYGWDPAMSDEEMLGRLLTLDLERAGPSGMPVTYATLDESAGE
jgi:hypothetical protein